MEQKKQQQYGQPKKEQEEEQTQQKQKYRLPLFPIEPVLTTEAEKSNYLLLASRLLSTMRLNWKIIVSGVTISLLATVWYYPTLFLIFAFLLYSLALVFVAIVGTIYMHFICTTDEPPKPSLQASKVLSNVTKSNIFDLPKPIRNPSNLPIVFGRTVDLQLQQIIEYVLRDFMLPWLGFVVTKPRLMNDIVREDLWNAVQKLHSRGVKIDPAKIIAVDMVNRVTVHLEKIRIAEARAAETASVPVFSTNAFLVDDEHELEFLRKTSEILVIMLLPRGYSLSPLKILLSEILSYKIFFPLIKMITSPDYINQKIVQNIETRLAAAAMNKRSYEYAASFEEFIKMITNSNSLEELSLIRKSILNDMLHATTMQNLQRAKGIDADADPDTISKSDLNSALRLKRYMQQLTFAKAQCEKNLSKFGWNGNYSNDIDLSLNEILSTPVGRRYLTLFLEPMKASALVGFYTAVEDLKHAPKTSTHHLAAEIFYNYVRVPKSEIQIDKIERKQIETFLMGDAGPDIFYEIQKKVLQTLEEKYYPPFVMSEQCRQLKKALDSNDLNDPTSLLDTLTDNQDDDLQTASLDCIIGGGNTTQAVDVAAHTTYARKKLETIQERIDKKTQALDALKYSVKPESKVLQKLEKEMEWLKSEKRQTEAHLRRTDAWTEHLGKWKATLQSVEVADEKESLQFMILVHVDEDINLPASSMTGKVSKRPSGISSGWVVMRSLTQVHDLQRKLRHMSSNLKSFDLPTNFKFFFLKTDRQTLEKAKIQIQKFLNFILEDDHLNGSEAIYTFLSPSSDHLKQSLPSPKKSKFSLSTLFKSDAAKAQEASKACDPFWGLHRDDEDISTYLEGVTTNNDAKLLADLDNKDSIAEPLYALMGEIFDMGGVFKWLRKSIISFVQITYGRTINRQIRESVAYLFEESMLHHYFTAILKSFWPGGILASAYPERSEDMKEMTTIAAKALLVDNIPEVLCNLVGSQAAKHGVLKVFEALQNPLYNKQLFYELLEILMIELFPEVLQLKMHMAASGSTSAGVGSSAVSANGTKQLSASLGAVATTATAATTIATTAAASVAAAAAFVTANALSSATNNHSTHSTGAISKQYYNQHQQQQQQHQQQSQTFIIKEPQQLHFHQQHYSIDSTK